MNDETAEYALTGAIFDVFVDIFHEQLLDRDLISAEVEDLADYYEYRPEYQALVQDMFDEAYVGRGEEFREALVESRGNRTKAAKLMGISRRTLHRKLTQWPELDVADR